MRPPSDRATLAPPFLRPHISHPSEAHYPHRREVPVKIRDILRTKGGDVIQIAPDRPMLEAVHLLSEHRIGALIVTRDSKIEGVISERDVLNLVADNPEALRHTEVADIMTSDVIVAVPDDDLDYVMNIMTNISV